MKTYVWGASARRFISALVVAALVMALAVPVALAAPATKLISLSASGSQTTKHSEWPGISGNGNAVVFESMGDYLGGDSNGYGDVYRRVVSKSKTVLVSRDRYGGLADNSSFEPVISAGGRYVAFASVATDITNASLVSTPQVFRRDLATGTNALVSKGATGPADGVSHAPDISAGGRYVVFVSEADNLTKKPISGYTQVYLRDLKTKKTYLISKNGKGAAGNGPSSQPAVSDNGRFVVFMSYASNLSARNEYGKTQIFLRDRKLGKTVLVSQHPKKGVAGKGPSDHPAISGDGRYIVFDSKAENLIKWHKDDNNARDVYKYDRVKKTMKRVSVDWKGRQLEGDSNYPDISGNGKVVYVSDAPSVVKNGPTGGTRHIYRRGLLPTSVKLVSQSSGVPGNASSWSPVISADGRYVAYKSRATNLTRRLDLNGDFYDIFRTGPY